jgi:DNA-binding SARP family transcriptional activator
MPEANPMLWTGTFDGRIVPALPEAKGGRELSEPLEVIAHGVTAILATWLGLLVVTRARRAPGSTVFGALCLLLVTWSLAIIVQRLTADAAARPFVNLLEDASAFLLPPATTHIAIAVAFEGRRSRFATTVLVTGYALAALAIIQAAVDPAHPIQFYPPHFAPHPLAGVTVAWAFAVGRLTIWAFGVAYLVIAFRSAGDDRARRRQLAVAVATVVLGVIGGMLRILPEQIGGPPWIGVSVVAAATVLATYAILAQHIFIAPAAAERAVRWSLLAGIGIVVYVAILVGLEDVSRRLLGIDFPLVTALAVVVTLALFEPVADRLRDRAAGSEFAAARGRLLRALGVDPILGNDPERAVRPALDRLVRTFELTGAQLMADGEAPVISGSLDGDDPLAIRLPLSDEGRPFGQAIFGPKRSGLSFAPTEVRALELAVDYLAATQRLAHRQQQQTEALVALGAEGDVVQSRGSALRVALAEAAAPPSGLRVFALGSLRAELDGEPVRRWGGEKAGARQAEAIFAFLFDRGDRGVAKDEILELVWPDVDLDRADVAFHRTMLGLRSALQPGRRARGTAGPITFSNDRYRLDPSVVAWSDVAVFEELLSRAGSAPEDEALRLFEQARAMYRGDYLDDCPFYGDSAAVEDRRTNLRQRYVDLLVELGERYARTGDRTAAASCLRQAQSLADDDLPRVVEALDRLALPAAIEPAQG